jgi:hypothetical protein
LTGPSRKLLPRDILRQGVNRAERVKRGGGATSRLRSWRPWRKCQCYWAPRHGRQNSTSDNVSFLSVPRVAGRLEGSPERMYGWINCGCFEMSLEGHHCIGTQMWLVSIDEAGSYHPCSAHPLHRVRYHSKHVSAIQGSSSTIIRHTVSHMHRHRATSSC